MALALDWLALRRRSGDLRGLADMQLVSVENGPGRGQRLLIGRNAAGLGFELAVDRGFDLAGLSWRGVNLGWRAPTGLPAPSGSPELEDGLGLLRGIDGFLVTCGLDHHGPPAEGPADHFRYDHRKQVRYPLHGRLAQTPATLISYGLAEAADPILWCEGEVRQAALFAEHLTLRRRIEAALWSPRLRIVDEVVNHGFEPVPHAMLYHFNVGYPLLDAGAELFGPFDELDRTVPAPTDRAREMVDRFAPPPGAPAVVGLSNPVLGAMLQISFDPAQLPSLGVWRCWRSGLYALGLEPCTTVSKDVSQAGPHLLRPGERRRYEISVDVAPVA